MMSDSVSRALGQQLVVENLPGASGIIAHQTAARATPDGYTFLFTNTSGPRHQSGDVQDAALRSGQGLHAGRDGGGLRPADAVGQRRRAGENRRRADRIRQGQSRQAVLRGRRDGGRSAVCRAAAQQARQPRHGRGAVQVRRADGAGRGERHRPGADLIDGRGQRDGASRQDPPPRAELAPSAFRRCPTCRPSTKPCPA